MKRTTLAFLAVFALGAVATVVGAEPRTYYRTIEIDGLEIFYREAGDPGTPHVLLLHGFPTSSHMFRNLIRALSDRFEAASCQV